MKKIRLDFNWWKPYLLAVVIGFVAKLPTLNNNIFFIDEPIYLVEAQSLGSFSHFVYSFQYLTDTKFQLSLIPYLLSLFIDPTHAVFWLHFLGLIAIIVSIYFVLVISKLIFHSYALGLFSALIWCLYLNSNQLTTAVLLEYFQTPLLLLSIWLFIKTLEFEYRHTLNFFWSGFAIGLASLVKPPAILVVGCLLIFFIAYKYFKLTKNEIRIVKPSISLLLGASAPIILSVFPYLLNSTALSALRFNLFELPVEYTQLYSQNAGLLLRAVELMVTFGIINVILFFSAIFSYFIWLLKFGVKKFTKDDFYVLLLLSVGGVLFLGYTTGQSKAHYLVPVIPFLMVFEGYTFKIRFVKLNHKLQLLSFTAFCLVTLIGEFPNFSFFYQEIFSSDTIYSSQMPDVDTVTLNNYIKNNSQSEDYIWVYYNAPEFYLDTGRKLANTDPACSWLSYLQTPYWINRTVSELSINKPKLIIGINNPRYPAIKAKPLTEITEINNMLTQLYNCSSDKVANVMVCERKKTPNS